MGSITSRRPLSLFKSVFLLFFCRDDDKIQSRYVGENEGEEERAFALKKRGVRVVDLGLLAANVTLPRVASSATSVEEITPLKRKARVDKEREGLFVIV